MNILAKIGILFALIAPVGAEANTVLTEQQLFQREPLIVRQESTVGPLHLDMTLKQVQAILGKGLVTVYPKYHEVGLDYTDGMSSVSIDIVAEQVCDIHITLNTGNTHHLPHIASAFAPLSMWKWMGVPISAPIAKRHAPNLQFFSGHGSPKDELDADIITRSVKVELTQRHGHTTEAEVSHDI